jgi:hypothetical protein
VDDKNSGQPSMLLRPLASAPQGLPEPLDLGDRTGVQSVEDVLRDPPARGRGLGVIDRADLLVDAPVTSTSPCGSPIGRYFVSRSRCMSVRCSTPVSRVRRP